MPWGWIIPSLLVGGAAGWGITYLYMKRYKIIARAKEEAKKLANEL
jgi:hypothetical protein